ncbi:MAG: DUF881 domain-containing protein [Oryzihumus sp.]
MDQAPHRLPWRVRISGAVATRLRTFRRRSRTWRLLVPAVFLLAGMLFVTSAVSSGGTDLRASGYTDLDGLANSQRVDVERLRAQAADLNAQVNELSTNLGSGTPKKLQQRVEALRAPAGLTPVHGPGVTITLNDAPAEVQNSVDTSQVDISNLLVHQQDIQAVANALWAGGAEAMTIQGQRVVSTTGIKCVGNSVVLHDVPYAPPYYISAIGPVDKMLSSVNNTPYIDLYFEAVQRYDLGWDLKVANDLQMPGFTGSTDLRYAHAAGPGQPITGNAK